MLSDTAAVSIHNNYFECNSGESQGLGVRPAMVNSNSNLRLLVTYMPFSDRLRVITGPAPTRWTPHRSRHRNPRRYRIEWDVCLPWSNDVALYLKRRCRREAVV